MKFPYLERRYGALRTIAGVLKFIGVIALILAGIAALLTFGAIENFARPFAGPDERVLIGSLSAAGVFVLGLLIFLVIYALGENIKLFIDMEENTRATRIILDLLSLARPNTSTFPESSKAVKRRI